MPEEAEVVDVAGAYETVKAIAKLNAHFKTTKNNPSPPPTHTRVIQSRSRGSLKVATGPLWGHGGQNEV